MPTVEVPFAPGEWAWRAVWEDHEDRVECPECCGTKAVTVILGNGEEYSLACRRCSDGYYPPKGYVVEHTRTIKPGRYKCNRIVDWRDGVPIYSDSEEGAGAYTTAKATDLFATESEAGKRAAELIAEHEAEEERRSFHVLKSKRKDLAWSVHYWRGVVRRLERDLENARKWLTVAKEKKNAE